MSTTISYCSTTEATHSVTISYYLVQDHPSFHSSCKPATPIATAKIYISSVSSLPSRIWLNHPLLLHLPQNTTHLDSNFNFIYWTKLATCDSLLSLWYIISRFTSIHFPYTRSIYPLGTLLIYSPNRCLCATSHLVFTMAIHISRYPFPPWDRFNPSPKIYWTISRRNWHTWRRSLIPQINKQKHKNTKTKKKKKKTTLLLLNLIAVTLTLNKLIFYFILIMILY